MVSSEFGRTPKINKDAGRDHWPKVFSVVLAGGGIKRGYIYGASNATASEPDRDPIGPEDLATTVYHLLGIVADKELMAPATGRSRSSTAARSSRICWPEVPRWHRCSAAFASRARPLSRSRSWPLSASNPESSSDLFDRRRVTGADRPDEVMGSVSARWPCRIRPSNRWLI